MCKKIVSQSEPARQPSKSLAVGLQLVCQHLVWLLLLAVWLPQAHAAGTCSAYKGQVFLNEVRVGASKASSTANQIELYNSAGVASTVWLKWKLVVNYARGTTAPTVYSYALSTGFSNLGSFIYNSNKAIYWRNRDTRFMDVALVDEFGDFIDYLAVDRKNQTVPACMGTTTLVNATATADTFGDIVRLPDGGTWLSTVTNTSANTIGRTNVCSSGVSDLVVSNSVDIASPTAGVTPVTYTITVLNKSCTNTVNAVQITDTNIVASNFSGLSYVPSVGSTVQSGNNRVWNVGNLAAGSSAMLTISGTPINVGTLTTTASVTVPSSGLSLITDDSAVASINAKNFNYVSFDLPTETVTEGTDTSYTASISSNLVAGSDITVNYTVTGTAGAGDTNLPSSGSVTISPSSADTPQNAFITFNITNDYVNEPTKTIVLTITSVTSADNTVRLDPAASSMTISLLDDDPVPTDTVVVRAYGRLAGGVAPIMQLWLNGRQVGEVNVTATSFTDYAFAVALPDTGTLLLDLVYPNDGIPVVVSPADRNLYINSVRVRGQVLLPTDAGVTYDKGTGALAFDGVDVIPGQGTMGWDGALRFNVALTRPMVAEFHLEEGALTGAAGEVKDTAAYTGGPFNGRAIGSPLPTPNRASPALANSGGSVGTCGYATFAGPAANGGAMDITGLPVSTTANAQTTVAFWMYWDGVGSVRPIGWQNYDLWLTSSAFGFNTSAGDVQGIVPSGLANSWHHIVAVFTNGDVTQNLLYIDGVKQTLTALQSVSTSANAVVQSTLRIGGWVAETNYRFSGHMDEVKVYNGAISQTQVSALFAETHSCTAVVIAQYHLDETTWSGTAGEVLDSSGRGVHGKATGVGSLPKTLHDTPALSGANSGTCGYGNFAGAATKQAVTMGAPDFGIGGNPAFSLSAWARWGVTPATGNQWANIVSNGNSGSGQFWLQHAQLNNRFEFAVKTSVNRNFVQSKTAPVAGQWYHIAGVYDGTALHIYVNGVLDDNSAVALTGTVSPYVSTYQFNIGIDNSIVRGFQGDIDEVQLFGGALSSSQVSALYAERHACPTYPPSLPAATNFNCVETGAAAASGHLYTKRAGTAFSFDVAALRSDGTVDTTYAASASRSVTVELVDGTSTTACASRSALSPAISQTLSFSTSDAGRKTAAPISVARAYADLRCRVTDANQSPGIVGCSSDDFAVRPNGLSVTSSASADATGLLSSASPALKTAANFSLTAASDVVGTTTAPKFDASKLSAHVGATQVGTLSGNFGSASAGTGVATGADFAYSEAGYFRFAANGVYDDSFTAVDSAAGDCTADFSNTAVGGKVGCNFGNLVTSSYFGRFIPDHFDVTVGTQGVLAPACLAGSFTYAGQAMGYTTAPTLTITPINAATGTGITANYVGAFQKLSPAGVHITAPTTDATQMGKDGTALTTLSASLGAGSLSNSGGVMTYALKSNDLFTYTRNSNALVAPYTSAVSLVTTAVSDGEAAAASLPTLQPSGASIRFGRLRLQNVFGSERLPLVLPIQAQHYVTNAAGTGYFTANADDHCTPLSLPLARTLVANARPDGAANLYFYPLVSGKNQLLSSSVAATLSNKLTQGLGTLQFAATGKQGWLDLILPVPDYLTYNWGNCNGQGSDTLLNDLPCARATFGVLGSKSPVIYMRENY